jgi:hypothetical protein
MIDEDEYDVGKLRQFATVMARQRAAQEVRDALKRAGTKVQYVAHRTIVEAAQRHLQEHPELVVRCAFRVLEIPALRRLVEPRKRRRTVQQISNN